MPESWGRVLPCPGCPSVLALDRGAAYHHDGSVPPTITPTNTLSLEIERCGRQSASREHVVSQESLSRLCANGETIAHDLAC